MKTAGTPVLRKNTLTSSLFRSLGIKGTSGRRGRFIAREGASPSVILVGSVRISTVIFVLSLLEAILWTSCLISSHSALVSDTVETEQYLVRETENLKANACRILKSGVPVFEQSYLLKQHVQIEQFWAQRTQDVWTTEHFDWLPLRDAFSLAFSAINKGIPGPFAGIDAIH